MTAPRYSTAHWGIYEVRPGTDGQPDLRPLSADPAALSAHSANYRAIDLPLSII